MNNNKLFEDNFLKQNPIIFKKYKTINKIGFGSFGNIYSVIRLKDNTVFAMKIEKINPKQNTLESEAYYLFLLQGFGIPKFITYGHINNYNILIETLLDKSLYQLFIRKKIKCPITDVCLIGIQILERLEWIHSKDIIYRDVKPENFLIGINDPNVIYIVDFGLCKKYRSSKTGKHLLPRLTGKFNGTLKYASPNVIRGKESSRRDDLISLGYMLIYLYKRELPWVNSFKDINNKQYLELMLIKETNGFGKLFQGIPKEFEEFIKYSRNLKFEQDPDYSYLRSLLNKIILNKENLTFSWIDSRNRGELIGIPRSHSKKKASPQIRILKGLKEGIISKIKRGTISEDDFHQRKNFCLTSNTSEISALNENNNTLAYSENAFFDDNSNISKHLVTEDIEREEKMRTMKRPKNIANLFNINLDTMDKEKINNTNNNYKKIKMKKFSKNLRLNIIKKENIIDRNESNENSNIRLENSIPLSNNNTNIINIPKNKKKNVNSLTQNCSKEEFINYNNNNNSQFFEIMNSQKNLPHRKKPMEESCNLINLTQDNTKNTKLFLSKNTKYKTPLQIKKIRMDLNKQNSYTTLNNNSNNNNSNFKNLCINFNNSEIKKNILFPKKRRTDNKINIIINRNPKNIKQKTINHYNTKIDLGRYLIKNSINLNINSKNQ